MSNAFKDIKEVEDQITLYIRAGVQCIQLVVGGQNGAAEDSLKRISKELGYSFAAWDCNHGWNGSNECVNLTEAIESVPVPNRFDQNTIVILRDPHYELMQNPSPVAALKGLIQRQALNTKKNRRPVILLTPSTSMNQDVLPYMKQLVYPLPSHTHLQSIFEGVRASISDQTKRQCSDSLRYQIATALSGLTTGDAADALSECIVRHGGISPEIIDTIEMEKGRLLQKSEVLSYVPKKDILQSNELGGYEELKGWLNERKIAYEPEAEHLGLDYPKGIVLVGVPGTGKSIAADVMARELRLPRVTFNLDAVFNSLVGESERRTREAIQTADALGGCVLLIDEADKVLGGAVDSTGDSGVTRRVFGQLLTWLSSKKNKTFVVLTMNRTKGMPPELLRKGRFDEIFFVDTPSEPERKAIFEIHMRKRRIDPAVYNKDDWKQLVSRSRDYVGAEIEQAVTAARFVAYREDPASRAIPTAAQLIASLEEIVPVTKVDPDNIEDIRKFGRDRARSASGGKKGKGSKTEGGRALDLDLPFDPKNN